jgi:hypothetical protein
MSTSFITPGHVRAFQAVTTQLFGEVTLASCRINGEPGVAIVLMEHVGEGKVAVMPLRGDHQQNGNRVRRRKWRRRRRRSSPRVQNQQGRDAPVLRHIVRR